MVDFEISKMAKPNSLHAALIVGSLISYLVMILFNVLSNFKIKGLFESGDVGNISDKYFTDVTPAGYTFSIWGIIYAWLAILVIYCLSTLCRKGVEGPLYRSPVLLPPSFFFVFILNNGFNIAWLLLWDREILVAAFVILALIAATAISCIGISMYSLSTNMAFLRKGGLIKERWWIWFGVQNALGTYATWTCIATTLNMAAMMEYVAGVSHQTSGTVALSFVLVGFLLWALLELAALDKHARYLFMPYVVVCWALGGVISKHWGYDWGPTDRNAIYTAVVLAIGIALGVLKIIIMLYKHFKKPMEATEITPTLSS